MTLDNKNSYSEAFDAHEKESESFDNSKMELSKDDLEELFGTAPVSEESKIKEFVSFLLAKGITELPRSFLRKYSDDNGLVFGKLIESLKQAGIKTKNKAITAEYPLPETIHDVDGIECLFKQLREEAEKSPNLSVYGLKTVYDFYEYLAFFSKGKGVRAWIFTSTDEIRAEFSRLGTTHAGTCVRIFSLCKDIDCIGRMLFDTDEQRRKYDNYLSMVDAGIIDDMKKYKEMFPVDVLHSSCVIHSIIDRMNASWSIVQKIDVYNHLMFDKANDYYEII